MTLQDDLIAYNHKNPVLWGILSILIEKYLIIFSVSYSVFPYFYWTVSNKTKSAVLWVDAWIKWVCSSVNHLYGL